MSPTLFWFFWIISPKHVVDVFGIFLQNHVADLFLMTILDMETIQENFYYSQDASLISLFHI